MYNKKQRANYFAQKSRKGSVSKNGVPLSDFQRGRNFGRAEQIGQVRGQHKYRISNQEQRQELTKQQAAYKAKQQRKFEAWCKKHGGK